MKTPLNSLLCSTILAALTICGSQSNQAYASSLININFGAHLNPGSLSANKTGQAAIGETAGDYWNFYSRDNTSAFDWRANGALTNLKLASGSVTSSGLVVNNAAGAWVNNSTDPMYESYLYPYPTGGNATFTLNNLAAGSYSLLVYAYDGNYQLNVGGTDYGIKTCRDNVRSGTPVWQEGQQYVRYDGVEIGAGDVLTLTTRPGLDGFAVISGMQIVLVPEPSVLGIVFVAGFLRVFKTVTKSKKLV